MEKYVEKMKKQLNWKDRLFYSVFKKRILKFCNIIRIKIVNDMIK